jgi:hypothetical protein
VKPILLLVLLNFFKPSCGFARDLPERFDINDFLPAETAFIALAHHADSIPKCKKKVYLIAGIHTASYAGTLAILGAAWYDGYAKTPFHLFNDSKEWLQMDKAGHAWTSYNIATYSARLWQWSGLEHRKAVLLGGVSALGYQTILEFLDAHSAEWGWSWADVGANAFGAALFTTQELAWKTQRVQLKFSSFPKRYDAALQPRADALFGNTFPERLLKDYNAQTYWASINLNALFQSNMPAWLNLAVGYGAEGMYGGFKNVAVDKDGNVVFDRSDIHRLRQWYLSPDIDWTRLKTNKKLVRTLFSLLNMIKVPAPALELRSGKLKAHWLSF